MFLVSDIEGRACCDGCVQVPCLVECVGSLAPF